MTTATPTARRQAGFTLPEILAVLALIGILISTLTVSFTTAEQELAMTSSKDTLINDVPAALLSYRARRGSLTGVTKTNLTDSGVPGKGPFGDEWTLATAAARTVQLRWLVANASDSDTFGRELQAALNAVDGSAVSSASYNISTDTLAVNYEIP